MYATSAFSQQEGGALAGRYERYRLDAACAFARAIDCRGPIRRTLASLCGVDRQPGYTASGLSERRTPSERSTGRRIRSDAAALLFQASAILRFGRDRGLSMPA